MLSKCYGLWVGSVREIWFWEREMDLWVLTFEREKGREMLGWEWGRLRVWLG